MPLAPILLHALGELRLRIDEICIALPLSVRPHHRARCSNTTNARDAMAVRNRRATMSCARIRAWRAEISCGDFSPARSIHYIEIPLSLRRALILAQVRSPLPHDLRERVRVWAPLRAAPALPGRPAPPPADRPSNAAHRRLPSTSVPHPNAATTAAAESYPCPTRLRAVRRDDGVEVANADQAHGARPTSRLSDRVDDPPRRRRLGLRSPVPTCQRVEHSPSAPHAPR